MSTDFQAISYFLNLNRLDNRSNHFSIYYSFETQEIFLNLLPVQESGDIVGIKSRVRIYTLNTFFVMFIIVKDVDFVQTRLVAEYGSAKRSA